MESLPYNALYRLINILHIIAGSVLPLVDASTLEQDDHEQVEEVLPVVELSLILKALMLEPLVYYCSGYRCIG